MSGHVDGTIVKARRARRQQEGTRAGFGPEQGSELSLHPGAVASLYNTCLLEGTFPDRWKRHKLLLLPKPGKPAGEASSYRPICLLDTIGKVFERVIATRLNAAMEDAGG